MLAAVSEFHIFVAWEGFFWKQTFLSVHIGYQTLSICFYYGHQSHIIAHHHPSIKKFLPAVTEMDTRTHRHTDTHKPNC